MLKVKNRDKQTSSEEYYWYYKDEKNTHYLFSNSQLVVAKERALKNKEDIPFTTPTVNKFVVGLLIGIIAGGTACVLSYFLVQNFLIN